jgi:hypothetical protein
LAGSLYTQGPPTEERPPCKAYGDRSDRDDAHHGGPIPLPLLAARPRPLIPTTTALLTDSPIPKLPHQHSAREDLDSGACPPRMHSLPPVELHPAPCWSATCSSRCRRATVPSRPGPGSLRGGIGTAQAGRRPARRGTAPATPGHGPARPGRATHDRPPRVCASQDKGPVAPMSAAARPRLQRDRGAAGPTPHGALWPPQSAIRGRAPVRHPWPRRPRGGGSRATGAFAATLRRRDVRTTARPARD